MSAIPVNPQSCGIKESMQSEYVSNLFRVHGLISQAGVNGFLDVARQTYKEINEDVVTMIDELNGRLSSVFRTQSVDGSRSSRGPSRIEI